ncbi:MAG: CDP-glycerol glycerophosphotransferase family protein [Methanobrevibacter sp.]|jgi:CDP-glycerol glycerophosphotransferase|nr:CDP-glycerol glycerophosphotransferase family protein [Candidatus Methanoflexus mossambicus]
MKKFKKDLTIEFQEKINIRFSIKSSKIVEKVILKNAYKETVIYPNFDGIYYSFSIDNEYFNQDSIGKNLIKFSYIEKKDYNKIKDIKNIKDRTIVKNANFTGFKNVSVKNNRVENINGYLVIINKLRKQLVINVSDEIEKLKLNTRGHLKSVKKSGGSLKILGIFNPLFLPIEKIDVFFEGEDFSKHYFNSVYDLNSENHGKIKIKSEFNFFKMDNLKNNLKNNFKNGKYDLGIELYIKGLKDPIKKRLGRTRYLDRLFFKDIIVKTNENTFFISPYLTISGYNISFNIEAVQNNAIENINNIKQDKKRDIWIVGEREYRAQDNGKIFFEYLRKNHPEREVYYVIDYDSPDYEKIKDLGNIINFRSKEHFELLLKATKLFFSHQVQSIYPLKAKSFKNKIKAQKIFLQHGVLGVKNLTSYALNQKSVFDTDMFCVSGEMEKQIVIDEFEYNEKQVKITGLPRFDRLFLKDTEIEKQIAIIPTWRGFLQTIDKFIESEYFERFKNLLSNEKLINHCIENEIDIIFGLHPSMKQYTYLLEEHIDSVKNKFFENKKFNQNNKKFPISIFHQGEVVVQDLLKNSALLVTDYSSVANDFSFLEKPVLYYQFDQQRFLTRKGSHLDLERVLPGEIIVNEDELVSKIIDISNNGFKMSQKYLDRLNHIITHRDLNNCKRVYDESINFDFKRPLSEKIKISEFYKKIFSKFRKSKFYYPIIKIYYALCKLLPLKERYIFESGLARQYSDAPRALYEELIKQKDIEAIWIYTKTSFNHPISTKVVRRLSPKYYYYLATSKYWINNQNFPAYIKKRKGIKFIQTWHGTPLKKMLNDLDKILGREEDYLKSVNNAIKGWDYLISQNPYSTEKFKSAFNYNGKIIEEGYPRNDIFFNENDKEIAINKIKVQYKINNNGKKIILYAPTFRDNKESVNSTSIENKFLMDINIPFKEFYERFKDDYILLIRSHLISKLNSDIPLEYKETIFNVSDYPDIAELFIFSDILITDYSSVFFDYTVLERPMIFYAYDKKEYINDIRGLYLDYDKTVPGPIVETPEELFDVLNNINQVYDDFKDKIHNFKLKYAPKDDGNASKRIIKKYFK